MYLDIGQQAAFDRFQALFGGNDRLMYTVGVALGHSVPFFALNLLYSLLLVSAPSFPILEKVRRNPGKYPKRSLVLKCVLYVTLMHLLSPILPYVLYDRALRYHPRMFDDPVPSLEIILLQVVWAYICTDFWFYWMHRLLHTSLFYIPVHKQHHEFHITIGWAAEYAHPLELLLGNIFPVVFAPVVFRYHYFVFAVWVGIAMMGTTFGHSGFKVPVAMSSGFHDFHHTHNTGNYGSMPYWDRICGSDRDYRRFLEKGRSEKKRLSNER